MNNSFYRAFEERYRGSRELIKGRLGVYLLFVESLLTAYPTAPAIDLGCGRGEWLELMAGSGFKPLGVDLDTDMLEACLERGLPVEQGDALAYLSALPDESQVVVSAFHFVEHIKFDQLGALVADALRVLKPGGLLIMETPNPENIIVATRNFYLDPTHQRPIPSMLLAFIAEYVGFDRVKTLRLQESKDLVERKDISLQDVFAGASPDYAVVAQKYASDDILALTSEAFSLDFGLSLEDLLGRWDGRFGRLETKAQQAETKAQQAETKAQQAEWASNERFSELQAVYASTSWKVTKPLRVIKHRIVGDCSALGRSISVVIYEAKKILRKVLSTSIKYVFNQPPLRKALSPALKRIPGLHNRLLRVAVNTGVLGNGDLFGSVGQHMQSDVPPELVAMTPHARQIFLDLKAAIESKRKGVA